MACGSKVHWSPAKTAESAVQRRPRLVQQQRITVLVAQPGASMPKRPVGPSNCGTLYFMRQA